MHGNWQYMQAISSASYPIQPNRCACAFKINPHPHQINSCQPKHTPNQQQFKLNLQNNAKSSKVIPQGFNVGTLEHSKSIHVQTKSATVNPNTCQINQDEKTINQNNAFHSQHILNKKNRSQKHWQSRHVRGTPRQSRSKSPLQPNGWTPISPIAICLKILISPEVTKFPAGPAGPARRRRTVY